MLSLLAARQPLSTGEMAICIKWRIGRPIPRSMLLGARACLCVVVVI